MPPRRDKKKGTESSMMAAAAAGPRRKQFLKAASAEYVEIPKVAADAPQERSRDDGPPTPDDPRAKWATNVLNNKTVKQLMRDFQSMKRPKSSDLPGTFSTYHAKNQDKNRYDDILCLDSTRVILKNREPDDDYIHASWVNLPNNAQKYICTQGPLSNTVKDFWHMVYTEKCRAIIMVCDFVEKDEEKCYQYLPLTEGASETYGAYTVTLVKKCDASAKGVVNRHLKLACDGESCEVYHFMYNTWVDHIAPTDPTGPVEMLRKSKKLSEGRTIIVHCSAGIGRSATVIGIDYAYNNLVSGRLQDVSLANVVDELRAQRYHAVQTYVQYAYLYLCLLEMIVQDNKIPRKGKFGSFSRNYADATSRLAHRLHKKKDE